MQTFSSTIPSCPPPPFGPHSDLGRIYEGARTRLQGNEYDKQNVSPKMAEMQRELKQADEMVVKRFGLMSKFAEEQMKKIGKAKAKTSTA